MTKAFSTNLSVQALHKSRRLDVPFHLVSFSVAALCGMCTIIVVNSSVFANEFCFIRVIPLGCPSRGLGCPNSEESKGAYSSRQ